MDDITNTQQFDELINEQIELNLAMAILRQGEWGSYRNLSLETNQEAGITNTLQTSLMLSLRYGKTILSFHKPECPNLLDSRAS